MKARKQQIRKISALRNTNIVAYTCSICNPKGCPMVHRIIGKFYAKSQSSNLKDENIISLQSPFRNRDVELMLLYKAFKPFQDRRTYIVA